MHGPHSTIIHQRDDMPPFFPPSDRPSVCPTVDPRVDHGSDGRRVGSDPVELGGQNVGNGSGRVGSCCFGSGGGRAGSGQILSSWIESGRVGSGLNVENIYGFGRVGFCCVGSDRVRILGNLMGRVEI